MRKTISRLKSATVTAGLALCLGIAVCAVSVAFADGAPAAASAVPKVIAWHDSYDAALAASKTSAKPVMVFMFAAWCEYCKQFDTETFADAKVRALSTQFESFRFDGDKDTQLEEKVAGQNHFPTVMFLSDGREVLRQVGFVAAPVFLIKMQTALDNVKLAEQIPALEAKIAADPTDAASLAQLGHIYTQFEQSDKALPLLAKAAGLGKDGKLGLLRDVKLDQAIGELRREETGAADHLSAWVQGNTGSKRLAEAEFHLGFAQAAAGKFADATKTFAAVSAAAPASPYSTLARFYAGLVHDRLPTNAGG
jgi:thioredoxin-like negative regulator of GroEL